MKSISTILLFSMIMSLVSAFTVAPYSATRLSTRLFSEPAAKDEEEGGLDLDLGEMWEMFAAAEKEEKFDDALKKVKGDK
jgi:multidrug efflux pump subunit AcrB